MTSLGDRPLTMQVVHDTTTTRISPCGEMDMDSAQTFETVTEQVVREAPSCIELDMRGVEFIDSSGLRSLLSLRNRAAAADVQLVITGLTPAAERVLELTGLIDELKRG